MSPVKTPPNKKQPAGNRMPKADFITSIILMVFSAFVLIESIRMPRLEHRNINPYSIPGLVPAVLGVIMGFFSITLFIRSMRHGGHLMLKRHEPSPEITAKPSFWKKPETIRVLLTVGFCLLYAIILVGWVWYPIATFVFTFIFIVLFEYDRSKLAKEQIRIYVIAAIEALLTAVLVSVVFRYLFLIRLP
ncbi:tripartite tricarboxylate transporter TctB family protein [Pleomorphochaeta sp. DL1XJH-081]|uniref:tripartite tricarboxylate transporter TctB family protein n=1 Tax=Pleomorphochaeta sp. DL1XJH-081 TaxID=3409690 RepID=UPI003BB5FAD7